MEPNFVRMKVPELKKYLKSVLQISVPKTFGFVWAHELAIKLTSIRRLLNQFGPRHQGTRADSKEYGLLQKQNILQAY